MSVRHQNARLPRHDDRPHDKDKSQDKRAFSENPGVDTHLESYMVAEKLEIHGELSNSVNKVEVEKSRIIKEIAQKNQSPRRRSTRRPSTSRFQQNQCTDKVVGVTVSDSFPRCK